MQSGLERNASWEEWPSGRDATTWHDGHVVDVDRDAWGLTVAQFKGCGFRVRIPAVNRRSAPFDFARLSATRVAEAFGQKLDNVAWDTIEKSDSALVVEGGWEYRPDQSFGAPWTRSAQGGRTHTDARIVKAVQLPWAWSSSAPTAGLPMISGIDASQSERYLQEVGAAVGLWFNHRNELCMSTIGPLLVQAGKRSWIFPNQASGMIGNWAFFQIANRLGALPAAITKGELAPSLAVCVISELANVHLLETIDDAESNLDLDQVALLMQVRRELFGE